MSGYYNLPGIPETTWLAFSDWIGYVKDDSTYGWVVQNGVMQAGDWSTITNKPTTFPTTLGTTSTTAKAGNYSPSWSEINSVIPVGATFPAILGTSGTSAKPGNWYPAWSEITGKPDVFPAEVVSVSWDNITGKPQLINQANLDATLGVYYNKEAVDAKEYGRLAQPTLFSELRPLDTIFRPHNWRPMWVTYSVEMSVTSSITGAQKGEVHLELCPDEFFTDGVQTAAIIGLGQSYTLASALQGVSTPVGCVSAFVPTQWYVRLRTVNVTGTPTFTMRATQEALL